MSDYVTAVHESGHGAACYLLGATAGAGPVTIVPAGGNLGRCFGGHTARPSDADMRALGAPYPLYPARLRRRYETSAMIYFAGQIAEDAWLARGDMTPLPVAAEEDSEVPREPVLPERERDLLDATAAADPVSDLGRAMDILINLHCGDEELANRHAHFLHGDCEALMRGARAGRLVRALAAELQVHKTLSARRWLAILRAAD